MLRTFFRVWLLVPILNVAYILALALRADVLNWEKVSARIQAEGVLLAFSLRAVLQGRYPTSVEMLRSASLQEYLISVLLCWLLAVMVLMLARQLIMRFVWRHLSTRQRLGTIGLTCLAGLIWLALLLLPPPAAAYISVDATQSLGGFLPRQAQGFSQGGESEMQQPGYFDRAMSLLKPIAPRIVRIDHSYDYYHVYEIGPGGQPLYRWAELDRVVDAIIAAGAKPLICISYLPQALARDSVYGPPIDLAAWEALVYQTVQHFNVERKLDIHYWEVWNEPNVPSFWSGTLDEYLQLYEATVRGALRADPSIWLGGPATASLDPWLDVAAPFTERNWITELVRYSQAHSLPVDFISWHYYDPIPADYIWSIRNHQQWLAGLSPAPRLLLTEWNWSAAPAPELDTEVAAAYAAAMLTTLTDSSLDQAFFFEPIDSSIAWEGRWGMMRKDGVTKPIYDTFRLMSELMGERLAVQSDHPYVGALAVREGDHVNVLVWHYGGEQAALPITLSVSGSLADSQSAANSAATSDKWTYTFDLPINSVQLISLPEGKSNQ